MWSNPRADSTTTWARSCFSFPATFKLDVERLDRFLPMLPGPERYALEFRHASWLHEEVYARLHQRQVALVIPDHPKMPQAFELTTDFAYVRMHLGAHGIGYTETELRVWAKRLLGWLSAGVGSYVYFNNDMEGFAIRDAIALREMIG